MTAWKRLIRFEDPAGVVRFGDAKVEDASDIVPLADKGSLTAIGLEGQGPFDLKSTGAEHRVSRLLGVLTPDDVPLVKCVGLNYVKHIKEGGRTPPPYPSIFIKPRGSIASFNEDVPIPKIAQDDQLDYEGELVIVIGKTGRDIPRSKALDYVAGFTVGNDVSARKWQRDPAFAGGVPQWCFSKGFDKFAPLGVTIVSPAVVGNASGLRLRTIVNGEVRQDTGTDDLLFGVDHIIEFVSQGTTLEKGTVIMTGTPAGVAMGMKTPKWLVDGDEVEVSIEKLGSLKNKMLFQ